jgi:hypothetical protein
MYIPINNPQGGDENISSFDEDETGCSFILSHIFPGFPGLKQTG